MTQNRKSPAEIFKLLAIQDPARFMELAEIACDRNSENMTSIDQEYFEQFIGLDKDQMAYGIERILSDFQGALSDPSVANLVDSDEKIFDFFRLFLGMLSTGRMGFTEDGELVFVRVLGDPPDEQTQQRIDDKIKKFRPLIIAMHHDFFRQKDIRSSYTEDQRLRMTRLQEEYEKHNIEGIFVDKPELTPEQMAMQLWKNGYCAFPTIESMIDELEKILENKKNGANTPGAKYIFKWQVGFILSDPKGVPVPAPRISELKEVIEAWVQKKNLQLDGDIYVDKYDDLDDEAEDDDLGDQGDNDVDNNLYEESEDTAPEKVPECNRQQCCETHTNTLRVIEHLSYIVEAALINCTGDAKYELSRLIDAIRNKPEYKISEGYLVAEQLYEALEYYTKSAHIEGASILSATIRKLWERIFDVSSGVMKSVDDQV